MGIVRRDCELLIHTCAGVLLDDHLFATDITFDAQVAPLIKAVGPYTAKTGTAAACYSDDGGRDIQPFLISYVENFVKDAAGKRFNPHVTIGVATEKYLNAMLAEPFPSFTFSPAGASVYQLGSFGTARKELKALTL